jgi:hypothetical protein
LIGKFAAAVVLSVLDAIVRSGIRRFAGLHRADPVATGLVSWYPAVRRIKRVATTPVQNFAPRPARGGASAYHGTTERRP